MILFFGAALLILPVTEASFINRLRPHLVDTLKNKCESLPYRSVYDQNRCYFAVIRKVAYSDAPNECSSILTGSKVALKVPAEALHAMMLDKSKFHTDAESNDEKNTLCIFESGYKCEKGQTMIHGKCGTRADKKMKFVDAQKQCKKFDMELLSLDNDLDNELFGRELVKSSAWTQKSLDNRGGKFVWALGQRYSRFTTCDGKSKTPSLYAGAQTGCKSPMTAVVDATGYWSNTDQKNEMEVICTKSALNEFTPPVSKKKTYVQAEGPCPELHEKDASTGRCEWTGPVDACAQLVDYWKNSYFITMEDFPAIVHREECLQTTKNLLNDYASKVIVRRGCMFTGYAYPLDGNTAWQEVKVGENLQYGAHRLPNYMSGNFSVYYEGLSRANCFCDPAEATVNGHNPEEAAADAKCIEHHEYNETTRQCEWVHDHKFCAEISTSDNRRMRLEIPNWPQNRKYDVQHYYHKQHEQFHILVTGIIIRQHCFATIYFRHFHEWRTLPTLGYGNYTVASYKNGLATAGYGGSSRFVCECIR